MCPPRVQRLREELLSSLVGDWVSEQIRYHCRVEGCPGGAQCKEHAINHVLYLILQTAMGKKIVVPSSSRWWKCSPLARQLALGLGIHNIFARACPAKYAQHSSGAPQDLPDNDADPIMNMDDCWQEIHGWRVRKTHEFFCRADTCCNLLVFLRALEVPHMIMRWLMKYETKTLGKLHPEKTRQQVAIEFVQPEISPATEALSFGGKLLSTDCLDYWAACVAYNPGAHSRFIRQIWQSTLPILA